MDHMKQVADAFASLEKNVLAKLDGLDFKQRELSDEILQLKQRGAMLPMDGLQRGNATLARVSGSRLNRTAICSGRLAVSSWKSRRQAMRSPAPARQPSPAGASARLGISRSSAFNMVSPSGRPATSAA